MPAKNNLTDNNNFVYHKAENESALFIFAHGAGADMNHEFMSTISQLLNKKNISVLRFNFPYMIKRQQDGKRRPPDRMPKLLDYYSDVITTALTEILIKASQQNKFLPLFIGGKSMGGRVAATVASIDENHRGVSTSIKGVICLGYPFHPQKKPEKLRLEPLQKAQKPLLIIQGERDLLGSADEINNYYIPSLVQCHFLPDGDHSLKPRVKSGFTYQQHINTAIEQIKRFIDEHS